VDTLLFPILLAIGALILSVLAAISFWHMRTAATLVRRAKFKNDTKMYLCWGMFAVVGLTLAIMESLPPINIPAIGWLVSVCLWVLLAGLSLIGFAGAVHYCRQMTRVDSAVENEDAARFASQ
jgi:uncharacterized protein YacL